MKFYHGLLSHYYYELLKQDDANNVPTAVRQEVKEGQFYISQLSEDDFHVDNRNYQKWNPLIEKQETKFIATCLDELLLPLFDGKVTAERQKFYQDLQNYHDYHSQDF